MKTYAYRKLCNPSDKELNDLGAQGWRVGFFASSKGNLYVIMERSGEAGVRDPGAT